MRREVKNEDSKPLNETQPTLVNSSCHKGRYSAKRVLTSKNTFLLKTGFYCNIYTKKINLIISPFTPLQIRTRIKFSQVLKFGRIFQFLLFLFVKNI